MCHECNQSIVVQVQWKAPLMVAQTRTACVSLLHHELRLRTRASSQPCLIGMTSEKVSLRNIEDHAESNRYMPRQESEHRISVVVRYFNTR